MERKKERAAAPQSIRTTKEKKNAKKMNSFLIDLNGNNGNLI